MSEPRKLEVLRAIVEDYVHSREPVGSKALVERHHLGVSSATIRNDMAALEDEGLITAPHTSAGRIPTDKGYRLFVDQISAVKPLSPAERRAIQSLLEGSDDLDDVLERTVRLLAQLTNQVAVVQYPHLSRAVVRHIEFVQLAPRKVLIVLIADSGKVEQRVVDVGQELSDDTLSALRTRFLAGVAGTALTMLPQYLAAVVAGCAPAERPAAVALSRALEALSQAAGKTAWSWPAPRTSHGPTWTSPSASDPSSRPSRNRWSCCGSSVTWHRIPAESAVEHWPGEPLRRTRRGVGGCHRLWTRIATAKIGILRARPHGLSHHHGRRPRGGPLLSRILGP